MARGLFTLLVSETAPELSEPSDSQGRTQMNATSLHFPDDAPGSHLYFLAESYNPHFFAFFRGFVPAMLLVCYPSLNSCSVFVSSCISFSILVFSASSCTFSQLWHLLAVILHLIEGFRASSFPLPPPARC